LLSRDWQPALYTKAVLAVVIAVVILSIIAIFSQPLALRILAIITAFVSAYTVFRILGMYKVFSMRNGAESMPSSLCVQFYRPIH
jgi:hypothetical protein